MAESTAPTLRKDCSKNATQYQMEDIEPGFPRTLPKSATFTPDTEYQKKQNCPAQVTVRVSMNLTPLQGQKDVDQPCTFPEVFITLGAPGDNLVIPLSPVPGRSLSLILNLVPKEDPKSRHSSPRFASPMKTLSRPLSPNPVVTNTANPVISCSSKQGKAVTRPISPDEDCSSLIEKVHTAQLQKWVAQGGQKWKGDRGKGLWREKAKQGKVKGAGKKDGKDGGNK
ncbi:hypothetical protein EXN66_Car015731 [Channa argus]|uniref:Uncharacterized protein n=2 Tax=Channa argus TaxID=215402 RepID=A0A6G1QC88_CHAAH|nr:hypothetical protein EXN66_Car015731 [Channa argus]